MFWSVVGLAGMVTIGPAPETIGDKSLGDAEDSEDAYLCLTMAGDLMCSLAGMLKIHLSDSSIKVHVPEPIRFEGSGCTA